MKTGEREKSVSWTFNKCYIVVVNKQLSLAQAVLTNQKQVMGGEPATSKGLRIKTHSSGVLLKGFIIIITILVVRVCVLFVFIKYSIYFYF